MKQILFNYSYEVSKFYLDISVNQQNAYIGGLITNQIIFDDFCFSYIIWIIKYICIYCRNIMVGNALMLESVIVWIRALS